MENPTPRTLALLLALVCLCYVHGHYREFVFDDVVLIQHNEAIRSLDYLPGIVGLGPTKVTGHRVIRNLTYAIDYHFWGDDALGYHLTNLALHLLCVLLVLAIGLEILPRGPYAFVAALLWGVHPVHTECVTYLSGRRDLLSALFYCLAFLAYLRWRKGAGTGWTLVMSAFAYVIGCFTKEVAVTLPGVIAAHEFLVMMRLRRRSPDAGPRELVMTHVAPPLARAPAYYALLVLFPPLFTLYTVRFHPFNIGHVFASPGLPTDLANLARYGVHYLKLLVFPNALSIDYFPRSLPPSTGPGDPFTLAAFAILAVLVLVLASATIRGSAAAFGGLWFVVAFLPMSNLIIPINEPVAEHYLYLPSVGFALALAYGLFLVHSRWPSRTQLTWAAVIAAAACLALRTDARNREWENAETIYRSSLEVFPGNFRLWNNLACYYLERDITDKGLMAIDRAIALAPEESVLHENKALLLRKTGRCSEAQVHYRKALERRPDSVDILLGMAFNQILLKDFQGALKTYARALALGGDRVWYVHHWRGVASRELGRFDRARAEFELSMARRGRHPETLWQLALMARAQARTVPGPQAASLRAESIALMREAIGRAPYSGVLHATLGDFLQEDGQLDAALAEYDLMAKANPQYQAECALRSARVHRVRGDRARARAEYLKAKGFGFTDPALESWLAGK